MPACLISSLAFITALEHRRYPENSNRLRHLTRSNHHIASFLKVSCRTIRNISSLDGHLLNRCRAFATSPGLSPAAPETTLAADPDGEAEALGLLLDFDGVFGP